MAAVVAFTGSAINLVSGNGQSGSVGQTLASPLVVSTTSAAGAPISGVPVTFTITSGGGIFSNGNSQVIVNSDSLGLASASLTLGPAAGANLVQAVAIGLNGNPINFSATGIGSLTLASGNNQVGAASAPLASPFVVTLIGAAGIPISNTPITFTTTAGGGTLVSAVVNTNAQGQASDTLTLGSAGGTNTVTATASGLTGSPIVFSAISEPLTGITANPNPLSFDYVALGATSTATITVTSTGLNQVTISTIAMQSPFFTLSNLPALPLVLQPSASASFNVVFNPAATALVQGTVNITTTASPTPFTVTVSGTGVSAPSPPVTAVRVSTDQLVYKRGQPVLISGTVTAADGTGIPNVPVQVQLALERIHEDAQPIHGFYGSLPSRLVPAPSDAGAFTVTAVASSDGVTQTAVTNFRMIGFTVSPSSTNQSQVVGSTITVPVILQNVGDLPLGSIGFTVTVTPPGALSVSLPSPDSVLAPNVPVTIPVAITSPSGTPPAVPVSAQVQITATDPNSGLVDTETTAFTITLQPAVSTPAILPSTLYVGVNPGQTLTQTLYIRNNGYLPMTNATVTLQNGTALNGVSLGNANLGTILPGDSRPFL